MNAREEPGTSTEITASPAADHSDASPYPKKSRRSVQKRVVSVPVLEGEGGVQAKGSSEASPPSDSWAWRKYGQKPIKGSPYPSYLAVWSFMRNYSFPFFRGMRGRCRGYYRCSSSKGCPARKQVKRNHTDPTKFIITYSSDHNHPWSLPKNHHYHSHNLNSPASGATAPNLKTKAADDPAPADTAAAGAMVDPEENFSDLIVEEPSLLMLDNFRWPSNSPATAADDGLLYGSLFGGSAAALLPDDACDKFTSSGCGAVDEEEDALFAGLGELPECSVVFRRGFFNHQLRGGDDRKRCGLEAEESVAAAAAASWCGSTG